VRRIAEHMGREAGYTTILKLLQIMTEKGLVVRDEAARTHITSRPTRGIRRSSNSSPICSSARSDGSAAKLVLQALAASKTSPEDLAEIKKLLRAAGRPRRATIFQAGGSR